MTVYKLEAIDRIEEPGEDPAEEVMLIGFFSSLGECETVEKDYILLPGFSLGSCRFAITPIEFPSADPSAIDSVYVVGAWSLTDDAEEDIGTYLTEAEAEAAKTRFMASDRSRPYRKEEVYIDRYMIDHREWQEGFTRD